MISRGDFVLVPSLHAFLRRMLSWGRAERVLAEISPGPGGRFPHASPRHPGGQAEASGRQSRCGADTAADAPHVGVFTGRRLPFLHLRAGWQQDNYFFFFFFAAGPLLRFPRRLFLLLQRSRHEGAHHVTDSTWSLGARMASRWEPTAPRGRPWWGPGLHPGPGWIAYCKGERAPPCRPQFPPRARSLQAAPQPRSCSPARRTSRPRGSTSRAPFRPGLSFNRRPPIRPLRPPRPLVGGGVPQAPPPAAPGAAPCAQPPR